MDYNWNKYQRSALVKALPHDTHHHVRGAVVMTILHTSMLSRPKQEKCKKLRTSVCSRTRMPVEKKKERNTWWATVRVFGLDTLYIPVSAHCRRYRKSAFFKMRGIHANATNVLVLDACLQDFGERILERQRQSANSEWTYRLWILQEDVLPKPGNLLIQYRHYAAPLSSPVNEVIDQGLSEVWHNLAAQTDHLLRKQFP